MMQNPGQLKKISFQPIIGAYITLKKATHTERVGRKAAGLSPGYPG
jgi:hypothetical protein